MKKSTAYSTSTYTFTAILSGSWLFFLLISFLFFYFFPHTTCGQLVPEGNLHMTVICQGLLLVAHLLNVTPLQLKSRKGMFIRKECAQFFLIWKIILSDMFFKDFGCFLSLLEVFFLMVFTWNITKWIWIEAKFAINKLLWVSNLKGKEEGGGGLLP